MNLVKWENNQLTINPTLYTLKAFKNLWNADRSKSKEKAINTLGIIYFVYDPRSDYQHIEDEKERLEQVVKDVGYEDKFKKDRLYEEAAHTYASLTITTSSKTLAKNRNILVKIDEFLENVVIDDDNITKIIKAISDKNDLAVSIAKAEKEIFREVEEHLQKTLSKGNISIGDEGLTNLFNEDGAV